MIFKKPVWVWLQDMRIPEYVIFSGHKDKNLELRKSGIKLWLIMHSLIDAPHETWPEEYRSFKNQLSLPILDFTRGKVKKVNDEFWVYSHDDDGTIDGPIRKYQRDMESKKWKEISI